MKKLFDLKFWALNDSLQSTFGTSSAGCCSLNHWSLMCAELLKLLFKRCHLPISCEKIIRDIKRLLWIRKFNKYLIAVMGCSDGQQQRNSTGIWTGRPWMSQKILQFKSNKIEMRISILDFNSNLAAWDDSSLFVSASLMRYLDDTSR